MKLVLGRVVMGAFLAVIGVSTNAAPQWCQGTLGNLWIHSDGTVFIQPSYRGDQTRICNVNAETSGVSVVNCIVWVSMLKSALQSQASVTIFYPDAPSCNTLPTYWSSPVPGYVMQN
jgi:hypothetical protein